MALSSPALLVLIPIAALLVPLYMYIKYSKRSNNPFLPVNWPIVGFLPAIVANLNNLHDFATLILSATSCNFKVHGPLMSSMQFFLTSDPQNVRHIFTTNHVNYPKGEEFAEIFDIMRGSLFTLDYGESCRQHRAKIQSILTNPRMLASITCHCHDKVRNGLLPFLTHMAKTRAPFDIEQLSTRYAFDMTTQLVFGADAGLLSPDMPPAHIMDAMDTVMEVPFIRHVMPTLCWKAMRWLGIGPERRLATATAVLRGFVVEMMEAHRLRSVAKEKEGEDSAAASSDIHSSLINDPNYGGDQVLHATLIATLVAGRDTVATSLSWLCYNIIRNPSVLCSIRKELVPIASRKAAAATTKDDEPNATSTTIFEPEDTKELVYLQAAVFESLRLYPPGPIQRRTVLDDDVLPSGHEVRARDIILVSLYAMARMERVWGGDCHQYKPERWLSADGSTMRYVPSHQFFAFNSGPRMCIGKDIGVMQLKTAIANMVWNFDMELLEGHAVEPKLSGLLQMKNGLMVKAKKRLECNTEES